jgi:hypothetical protein
MKVRPSASSRVVKRGRSLGLPLKAAEGLCVVGDIGRQEFERNETVQLYVFGFVHDTHPAAAQLLDDAVVGDGLADHLFEGLTAAVPFGATGR